MESKKFNKLVTITEKKSRLTENKPVVTTYCTAHGTAQCSAAAWPGGQFGGGWIHVHVWLSPFACSPETVTTVLITYTPI